MKRKKQSPEHIAKRIASRRNSNPNYMPPGHTAWNKGKTKETDERVEKYASSMRLGRKLHKAGYVLIYQPKHPRCDRTGYVFEHIVVMENQIGRPFYAHEVIHHKDGNGTNNRIENLKLMTQKEHAKFHDWGKNFGKFGEKGNRSSPNTEFKKGHIPWNKK